MRACSCLRVQLFATSWAVDPQAPLSVGFSRQEYWSGLPFPPSRYLADPRIEPKSLGSPVLAGGFFYHHFTWEVRNREKVSLQLVFRIKRISSDKHGREG